MGDNEPQQADPVGFREQLVPLAEFRLQLRSFLSFSEQRAEALGITAQQYQMLQVVAHDGGCSISSLAARLLLRHNSAVELVDRAVRAGLVRRTADSTDLRRSMLEVTPHGQQVLAQLVREHFEYLHHEGGRLCAALTRIVKTTPAEPDAGALEGAAQ